MSPADAASGQFQHPGRYRFGDVVVDTHARTIARGGRLQAIEPKAYEVLLCLLGHAGELVTHEELLDHVWGHRHVTPGVLTRAIAQLRHALGDDAHAPRFIRTRHSLGYCFIGVLLDEPVDEAVDASTRADFASFDQPAGQLGDGRHGESAPPALPEGDERSVRPGPADGRVGSAVEASTKAAARAPYVGADAAQTAPVLPVRAQEVAPPSPATGGAMQHQSMLLWAALALLLLLAAGLYVRWRPASPAEPSIAVLPFTSADGSPDGRLLAQGLAIEMHDALARVPGLQVVAVPPSRGSAESTSAAVGQRLRVANVLEANVRRDDERLRIDARLVEPRTGLTRWSGQFDRADADVIDVQEDIAREVVEALLGALPDRRVTRRPAATRVRAAYDAYLLGVQALHASDGEAGLERSIARFREALAADPQFARAQAGICRAEIERFEAGLSAEAYTRARAACERAAAMAPELREVDLALGQLHRVRGDYLRAVRHFTRALDDVALQAAAHVGLGRTRDALGQTREADSAFEQALRLSPNNPAIHREVGYRAYLTGDLPAAIAAYRTATALAPDDERLWSSLGGLYLASGDTARAGDAFERSLAVRPNYAALSNYGSLRYDAGAYRQAAALYRRATALDPGDFRTWGNLGDALAAVGDAADAHAAYRNGARLAQAYTAIRGDDAQALALHGWYLANLGDARAARERLARAEALGSEPGEVALLGAQLHALLGDTPAARMRLDRARQAGVPDARLAASPVLAPLLDMKSVVRR